MLSDPPDSLASTPRDLSSEAETAPIIDAHDPPAAVADAEQLTVESDSLNNATVVALPDTTEEAQKMGSDADSCIPGLGSIAATPPRGGMANGSASYAEKTQEPASAARDALHDIVVQNAKLRQEAAHGALDLTGIEERVDAVLTDEVRAAFTQTLQKARAEMDKARELDRSAEEFLQTVLVDQAAMLHKGKSPTATPTAPKAMRQQQQQHPGKRALEDVLSSPPRTRLRRSPSLQSNASYAQRRSPSPRDKRYRSPEYERERRYRSHSKERRRDRSRDPYYRERHRSREKERSKERSRDRSREPYHSRNGDERRERYRSRERDRSYDSRYPRTKYPSARSPYARYPSPSGFYNRSYITNTSEVPYRSQHHDLPQSHPQSSSQSQSQSGSPHIHPRPPSLPRSAKAYSPRRRSSSRHDRDREGNDILMASRQSSVPRRVEAGEPRDVEMYGPDRPSVPPPSMDVDHNFPVPVPVPVPTQTAAPLTVPGVWAFCASGQTADVLECSFMLDTDTAAQWNVYDPDPESAPRAEYTTKQLHLQLYCIPLVAARANVMSNAQIEWPKKGLFIVEVNRGTSVGRMFVPDHEKPLPVNITHAVQKGLNIVRFIQLVGMESAFIIHASEETVPILDTTLP